jgi:hypothetical protein
MIVVNDKDIHATAMVGAGRGRGGSKYTLLRHTVINATAMVGAGRGKGGGE